MKPKTLILLAVAGGCGLVAMLGIQQAMQGGQSGAPKVRVLVAIADIQAGVELTDENIGFTELSVEAVPEDAVTSFEQYEERSLKYPAMTGDIIRQTKLGNKGEFTNSRQIPAGMRVVSIAVTATQTMSGMLQPGDRVDVLVTYQMRDGRGVMTTKTTTLLKYVRVFATDDTTLNDGASAKGQRAAMTKVVSLTVTPRQVSFIKLAENKGSLALSWRHPDDDEDVVEGEVDDRLFAELSGISKIEADRPQYARNGSLSEDEPDTKAFLDEVDNEAPQPVVVAAKNTWNLRIYQGDTPMEVSLEIPEDEESESNSDAAGEDSDGQPNGSLTDLFRGFHEQVTAGSETGSETVIETGSSKPGQGGPTTTESNTDEPTL